MSELTRFYSSDIEEIIKLIEEHHRENPLHGFDCACMDRYIQRLREVTRAKQTPESQSRVDYVLLKAIETR